MFCYLSWKIYTYRYKKYLFAFPHFSNARKRVDIEFQKFVFLQSFMLYLQATKEGAFLRKWDEWKLSNQWDVKCFETSGECWLTGFIFECFIAFGLHMGMDIIHLVTLLGPCLSIKNFLFLPSSTGRVLIELSPDKLLLFVCMFMLLFALKD